jgi:hypothetical protein
MGTGRGRNGGDSQGKGKRNLMRIDVELRETVGGWELHLAT